jgi:4-amino-4-deoxy-L-arabinose transferase-like glycosyltransferase
MVEPTSAEMSDRSAPGDSEELVLPRTEPRPGVVLALLLVAVLLPRLLVFPVNENLHGDAVVRVELAERWLAAPHWIGSFEDGAYQFGPLHLYLTGVALAAWPEREDAGRLVSLLFGVLSVIPLYLLTRRLFGWKAGLASGLAFAAWGMHIQMSTTAASEAFALFLVLSVLALFARGREESRFSPLFFAAILLNLACATRYDVWLLMPLLCLLLLFGGQDRWASVTRAVLFGLLCLPFPLLWMQGNELASGNPFQAVSYIEAFHRSWVHSGVGYYGELGYRLHNLGFWPAMALSTLSPLVGALAMVGLVHVWRRRPEHRWLVWVVVAPTAYFTFRGAVLLDFAPLGRFTVNQLATLLPFVAVGFGVIALRVSQPVRHGLVGATALLAVAVPTWMGLVTMEPDRRLATTLSPVSPLSLNARDLMQVAQWFKAEVGPGEGAVVVDTDPRYGDIQLAFYSGLAEDRILRARWPNFDKLLERTTPEYLVTSTRGTLGGRPDFLAEEDRVQLGDLWFEQVQVFDGRWQVYQRVRSEERLPDTGTAREMRERAGEAPRLSPAPPPVAPGGREPPPVAN